MTGIVLDDVWKVYADGTEAVRGISLEITDREFVVFVGPSGCGKTTALRLVAGLEAVSRGTVRIGERVVNDLEPKDRDIAMVFQNYALYPHMSVYDNMAFGLKLQKKPKREIEERVTEAARILGIDELLHRKPRALSGGQRQRVAMGRAIVRRPQAFLMDEPLSNLDAKLRVQTRAEIARLQHELGVTTLYVTHDQVEAMTMGDRVAVLRKGVLQQVAPPHELYRRPVNLFVAGFIGSPAMNIFEATLRAPDDNRLVVEFGEFTLPVPAATATNAQLRELVDETVIVGIRPEDMEDASVASDAPGDHRIHGAVDLREDLGSDVLVHVPVATPPAMTDDVQELAADLDDTAVKRAQRDAHGRETTFVARVSPRSTARKRDQIELVVDTEHLHLFDPRDGTGLYSEPN